MPLGTPVSAFGRLRLLHDIARDTCVAFISNGQSVAARSFIPPIAVHGGWGGAAVPCYHIVCIGSSAVAEMTPLCRASALRYDDNIRFVKTELLPLLNAERSKMAEKYGGDWQVRTRARAPA